MRVVRSVLGVLLALIGLLAGLAGAAAAFWLIGPDDTVKSGDQHLTSKGLAIASSPDLLDRHGPVLHVEARSTNGKPVFVGVARDFDVASYLKGFAHTSLVQVEYPIALTTQEQKGIAGPLAAPDTLDWWVARANGAGTQSIAWPITDGPYDVVVMTADGKSAPDVQVNLGIEIPNAFLAALGVLLAGLILIAVGILLILVRRRRPTTPQPVFTAPGVPAQQQSHQPVGPLRRVAAVGVVVALVSSCSAVPERDSVDNLTRPAITDETAAAVIKHYNEVNNAANRRRDDKLIATIEGGNLVRESQAGYTIDQYAKAKPTGTFTYTKPVIGAPQFGSYPMRFVSSSGISDNAKYRHLGLWERETAGSPWMMTFAAAVPATVKLPDLTGIRPAIKADETKLAVAPQFAATSLATYLTGGAASPRAAAFQPNAEITSLLAGIVKNKVEHGKQRGSTRGITDVFTAPLQSPAFVTKSGTAVVFVSLSHEYTLLPGVNWQFWWAGMPENAFSPAAVKYQSGLTSTTLHDAVLLIPPKGKGKIQVASFESQLIDAGGY